MGEDLDKTGRSERETAVAIKHDILGGTPPVITAKGKGELAKQILDIAFASGVKVRSDKDLVQILEKVELDTHIPVEAFAAIAEVLNYVYKLNGALDVPLSADFNMKGEPPADE